MKKMILILPALLLAGGIGIFWLVNSMMPKGEERISYNKEQQTAQIDKQLAGLDLDKIRAKENLIMEKSIEEIQSAIIQGKLSYEELTAFYLDRIRTYDAGEQGLNAVAEINPKAVEQARARDASPDKGKNMTGIPVLLKDNINTNDMPTSGGTYALKDFVPAKNAPLVERLLENGAVILGKSNLSELANFMDTRMPSGYSSKAGQTHNPFDPVLLSPSGSSSGSGAAVAANLSAVAIGTETTGSIIAPSAIHSIVGFKPTKDAILAQGVIPLSSTMDTAGPMAKTVKDAILLYNALVADPSKQLSLELDADFLKGRRIGLIGERHEDKLISKLKMAGATVVSIRLDESGIDNEFIINQDFRSDLNHYLTTYDAPVKTLDQLIDFNKKDMGRRAKYGQDLIEEANDVQKIDRAKTASIVAQAKARLNQALGEHKLDAIVFIDNEGVIMPAVAGYPEVTVPMGALEDGTPRGATFIAREHDDETLMRIAYSFEQNTKDRMIPEKYKRKS